MKTDQDLLFLASRPNDELQVLCDLLTHDRNGELPTPMSTVGAIRRT